MSKFNETAAIARLLRKAGIPADLKGYRMLKIAIPIYRKNPEIKIFKGLYTAVAEATGDTPSKAERAMRHAIEVGWDRGNQAEIYEMFGSTVSISKGKPTNGEFIAMIAEFVNEEEKNHEND